jgi:hypothetical protein
MDMISKRVEPSKVSLDEFRNVVNKTFYQTEVDALGMFNVFTAEYLRPNQIEMVETFMLMGSPLLLIQEKGEREMVALDPEYDTPKEDLDRDIQKTYLEKVKLFAVSKEAQPYVAKLKFTRG